MKTKSVSELMIPLEDYATVSHDATLRDAVLALETAHEKLSARHYKHRAVLVLDDDGKVVGKLSMHDVIVALEPAYRQLGDYRTFHRSGLSPEFLKSIQQSFAMWEHPLSDICEKAGRQPVGNVMYSPTDEEHVEAEATLDEAIHQMVVGSHQSLLVTRGEGNVVGVLRLTDVFREVMIAIRDCGT
jgi:CBS domain-containing protein